MGIKQHDQKIVYVKEPITIKNYIHLPLEFHKQKSTQNAKENVNVNVDDDDAGAATVVVLLPVVVDDDAADDEA